MLPTIPKIQGSTEERKLCEIYKQLSEADKYTLMSFASFLNKQEFINDESIETSVRFEVLNIPRPEKESVIKAIRRLTKTYPMIDKDSIFERISSLMTEHIMNGRSASSVIDDLEKLFNQQFNELHNG